MSELVHEWDVGGRTLTLTWVGSSEQAPTRVYAFAFTHEGEILLVGGGPGDPGYWLPGGGIEPGEDAADALKRELLEEAAATVHELERLGAQRVDDPKLGSEYQDFYWCRVTLAGDYAPTTEVSERVLVSPDEFLDALFWGRSDPKAAMLLQVALEVDRARR